MSNLDPPLDPLKVWIDYAGRVRIGDNTIDPHYVLATLTKHQALELARAIGRSLGVLTLACDVKPIGLRAESMRTTEILHDGGVTLELGAVHFEDIGVAWYWGDTGACRACGAVSSDAGQQARCPTCGHGD